MSHPHLYMVMHMPPDTPERWITHIWGCLESAPKRRKDPWRLPAIATVSPSGMPEVRQVVLRRARRNERTLEVHTDEASMKYKSIDYCAHIEFCFWNPKALTQVRLRGTVVPYTLTESLEQWRRLGAKTQAGYQLDPPPGQEIPSRHAYQHVGPPRFVRLVATMSDMDALCLGGSRHQRMRASWRDNAWSGHWVVP